VGTAVQSLQTKPQRIAVGNGKWQLKPPPFQNMSMLFSKPNNVEFDQVCRRAFNIIVVNYRENNLKRS
jgi:hypothetical protein